MLFVTEMLLLIGLRTWNRNVVSIDDYASCFDNIDPLLPYKKWTTKQVAYQSSSAKKMDIRDEICSQRVQAVFIVSDSVDWSRDIQVSVTSSFLDYRTQTIHLAEGKVFVIHLTRQKQKKKGLICMLATREDVIPWRKWFYSDTFFPYPGFNDVEPAYGTLQLSQIHYF